MDIAPLYEIVPGLYTDGEEVIELDLDLRAASELIAAEAENDPEGAAELRNEFFTELAPW